jgi:hypothetical protein
MSREHRLVQPLAVLALACLSPLHAELPPITDADWAAQAPPSDPGADTLILFKQAQFELRDLARQEASSNLRIATRLKVLAESGRSRGELEIPHSSAMRLSSLRGRTVQRDGTIVPIPSDARFENRISERLGIWVTTVAFPAVQVGSILEYEAELYFDSILYLEPWYLSDSAPVLHSEVLFEVPSRLEAQSWGRDPMQTGLQTESRQDNRRTRVRAWSSNLPGVPNEPFGPPFEDMATSFGVITTAFSDGMGRYPLLDTWQSACALVDEHHYRDARRRDRGVAQKARELAGRSARREQAEALYRFVRDQIRTEPFPGVTLEADASLEKVLEERAGDSAEKALLLQSMLEASRIPAALVWANERATGLAPMDVPNPVWFERVLVAVTLDGQRTFLDPSERGLPFGRLAAEVEGGSALLFDPRRPEVVELPATSGSENRRTARMVLEVAADGGATGTGELLLSGQHAAVALSRGEENLGERWQDYLAQRLPGFAVTAVEAEARPDAGQLQLRWRMSVKPEQVLGDELSLRPSEPLGPQSQRFTLPPRARRTPVVLAFADTDLITLDVTVPPGWTLEARPAEAAVRSPAGAFLVSVDLNEAERRIQYRRELTVALRQATDDQQYTQLRDLFAAAEANDAQTLALVRSP